MSKIHKPSPPEHIVVVDTNLLWHEEKSHVVHPDFDAFWGRYSDLFPMKLLVPEAVVGELLFQQTSSALKRLDKVDLEISEISKITQKKYSHRIKPDRVRAEVKERFDEWILAKRAEVMATPITAIDWSSVINASIWRELPFTPDAKNPKNEKGFRDALILETVAFICRQYSANGNIAFLCEDFALRTAADKRLGGLTNFSTYESLKGFESFIELTRKNLTEAFVKSILSRARDKFYSDKDPECLLRKEKTFSWIRDSYKQKIEVPEDDSSAGLFSSFLATPTKRKWELVGGEQVWIARPQFEKVEEENVYYWLSKITFVRLYQRSQSILPELPSLEERRLLILRVDVSWKANVRSDGRFFSCEISGSKESNFSFKEPTADELERYGIQKKINETAEAAAASVQESKTPESAETS
jgi:PIN domain